MASTTTREEVGDRHVSTHPTRELAKQVHDELKYLADTHGFSTTCFHGGVSAMARREGALRRGVDILVAHGRKSHRPY